MSDTDGLKWAVTENECLRLENDSLKEINKVLNRRIENLENMLEELLKNEEETKK